MRKILVPIKRVPDYAAKPVLKVDGTGVNYAGVKWVTNPFDEIAVEEAVRIKAKFPDVEITIVSIGPKETTEQLRSALALGADRAIHIISDEYIDSDLAHRALVEIYREDQYSLIIMGKQAVDSDASQTGPLLASALDLPQATFASAVEILEDWSGVNVTREVDGGLETIYVSLPAVVTTDLRLNEPRYPSLQGIVQAKRKSLTEIQLSALLKELSVKVEIVSVELPIRRKSGVIVSSVSELVEKLKTEAKVL